jgi:RHS repeat-associated protein
VLTRITPLELAQGAVTTMTYDTQGRMTQRAEPDLSSTWTYDAVNGTPCNNNTSGTGTTTSIGLLCQAKATGTATVSGGYIRNQQYDLYDRPVTTQLTLGGGVLPAVTTNYDPSLQLYAGTVFPDGNSTAWKYQGDGHTNGYAQEIDGKIGSTQTTLYTVQTRDAALRPLQTTTGDGLITSRAYDVAERLVWQATGSQAASPPSSVCASSFAPPSPSPIQDVGYCRDTISVPNVTSRTDAVNLVFDKYSYNSLQELTATATTTNVGQSSSTSSTQSMTYVAGSSGNVDGSHRIASKSDVGTYSYSTTTLPHEVASLSGTTTGSFTYDADGNTLSGPSAPGVTRSTTWTSFDMPNTVTEGSTTLTFYYDPEHLRVEMESFTAGTIYFWDGHAAAEKTVTAGSVTMPTTPTAVTQSTTVWRDYVAGPDGMVGVAYGAGSTSSWYFMHGDHQDSVTVIAGAAQAAFGYDAWGKRRYANGTADTAAGAITSPPETTRGYIGQEELDGTGLINLNARLYDPYIARFMSGDPMGLAAGPNRYAYSSSNPATNCDPTGLMEEVVIPGTPLPPDPPVSFFETVTAVGSNQPRQSSTQQSPTLTANNQQPGQSQQSNPNHQPLQDRLLADELAAQQAQSTGSGSGAVQAALDAQAAAGQNTAGSTDAPAGTTEDGKPCSPPDGSSCFETVGISAPKVKPQIYLVAEWAGGPGTDPGISYSGHVFLGGITPDGSRRALGFFPKNKGIGMIHGPGVVRDNTVLFELALSGDPDFTFQEYSVTMEQYNAVMNYMENYTSNGDYDLFYNSCVAAALQSLNAGGVTNSFFVPFERPNDVATAIQRGW